MKLISINIQTNLHNETVLAFLKKEKADVVCIQELLEEDFDYYKKELNFNGIYQPWYYINNPLYKELEGKKMGIAILANSIIDSGSFFCTGREENILKTFDEYKSNKELQKNNAIVWVNIKNNDGVLYKFITTHLPVTHHGECTPYQLEVIDSLLVHLNTMGEFVLCGDTNAPRGKESFSRLAKKYKDNIPLEYKTSIDQNLHKVKGIQFMVDCLFTTPLYKTSDVKLVDGVSDHMAVVANISRN